MDKDAIKDNIIAAIKTVMDPEIPADIYELGLIYTIELDDDGKVLIEMTLTSPMCPVADSMPMEVQEKVIAVEGVTDIDLRVVFDPPWDKSKMSEEAQLLLDMFLAFAKKQGEEHILLCSPPPIQARSGCYCFTNWR